jgi:GTP-binding protein
MGFTIAITGRPNVGKSTLFNRLLEQRKAIVDNISGVTRDRQYGVADWNGKTFNVIDTGGFVPDSEDIFETEIRKQVHIAIDEADAIIFMTDVTAGITTLDESMAEILRRATKPVFLAVNKVDNSERQLDATEFYSLGFDNIFFISSMSGSGTGELLDALTELIPAEKSEETKQENELPRFAIIGQPNVGKSSLLNALVGKERTIVSDIAGTTRDTIHTHYNLFQKDFILIDTAGLRKKNKEKDDLEFYSVIRAIKAMDEADVCLLILDAEKGITAQDVSIFSLAARKGKGIVLLVNKWDLIEKSTHTAREYEKQLKEKIAPFTDVPVIFISAKEKTRIFKAMDEADVCLLMLDAEKGITAQDVNIFSLAARKGKGIVLLVNKWDLLEKSTHTAKEYEKQLKEKIAPFTDVPVIFISAKEKTRIFKVIEIALDVYAARKRRIPTSKLNEVMLKAVEAYHAPVVRGHSVKIKFITQLPTAVPSFAFFTNFPDDIKTPYKNYLENQLRTAFDFKGVPVRIFFRKK